MDVRYQVSRKVIKGPISKKPKRYPFDARKSLGTNSRRLREKKADLPPLTPLHRLQRFKAIRDRNLKRQSQQIISHILTGQMEESKETVIEQPAPVVNRKSKPSKENDDQVGGDLSINGQNDHNFQEKPSVRNGCEYNGVTNGLSIIAGTPNDSSNINGDKELPSPNDHGDKSSNSEEKNNEGNVNEDDVGNLNSGLNKTKEKVCTSPGNCHEEVRGLSVEFDRHSSASSSTLESNTEFDSEEEEEGNVAENEEDEDVDVGTEETPATDQLVEEEVSVEDKKEVPRVQSSDDREEPGNIEHPIYSHSYSSASSYMTAYGSMHRISGRAPINSLARARKRTAQEALGDDYRTSPSQASPSWRFFPSSISGLWSPSAPSSKNVNDSMAVNLNEDSIRYNLNDTDMFSDASSSDKPAPSKKYRWGCSIM